MAISQVELPNNTTEDIHDVRITGVDSTPTSGSTNVVTSGGIYTALQEATQNLVSYPTFEINNAMHLTMSSPDASALSLFSVDNNGHLIMTV